MDNHKPYAEEYEETELMGNDVGSSSGHSTEGGAARRKQELARPARQRVEELEEQEWLKRQLSDWDHLDIEDDESSYQPPL